MEYFFIFLRSMNKEEIHRAFLNTTFRILGNSVVDIRINKTISELDYLDTWVFLTAWNPLPEILSEAENKRRNLELEEELKSLNLKYQYGVGISEDQKWQEDSFLIENCSEAKAHHLALKYGQLAFVYGERYKQVVLLYTYEE